MMNKPMNSMLALFPVFIHASKNPIALRLGGQLGSRDVHSNINGN